MKEIIVDTSLWIQAFRGEEIPLLEEALKGGRIVLPPLVLAELLSGARNKNEERRLIQFLSYIPLHPVGRSHWKSVGLLRAALGRQGLAVSIPDCHIAQCTLEIEGLLLTEDKIFRKMAACLPLKLG